MSSPRIAKLFASVALSCAAASADAAPWMLQAVLTPPTEAGYDELSAIGFGRTVAMDGEWLAVGAVFGSCPGVAGTGSVLMYRFDEGADEYVFSQQICGHGPGTSIAIDGEWLLLGWPHQDDTPGDSLQHGRVSFHRLDRVKQHWHYVQGYVGATDSLMGYSVALDGGVAAAGESGYNDSRGRVRTFRLGTSGSSWTSEGWLYPNSNPFARVDPDEGFGAYLALDVSGCRASNACTRPHDTLIVQSESGLHSVERLNSGWGTRALRTPSSGTTTSFTRVDVNESSAVLAALITPGATTAPCPGSATVEVSAVRLLARIPGSAHLKHRGHACMDQLGVASMGHWVRSVALPTPGAEFVVGAPDAPANRVGTVSTWMPGTGSSMIATELLVDPNLTPDYHAASGGSILYEPSFTGDYFGASVAANANRLVVGAPIYNAFIPTFGAGYVMIYTR